jgi:hypothetical protein
MSSQMASEEMKRHAADTYYSEYQPIQIPYRGGVVVISATDPCVQQYISK